jgi:hypothetical protein
VPVPAKARTPHEAYASEMAERVKRGGQPMQSNAVLLGDDFMTRALNRTQACRDGKAIKQFVVAEKV